MKITAEELLKNRKAHGGGVVGGGAYRVPSVQEVLDRCQLEKDIKQASDYRNTLDELRARRQSKHRNIADEEAFKATHSQLYQVYRPKRYRLGGLGTLFFIAGLAMIVIRLIENLQGIYFVAIGVWVFLWLWVRG